MSAVREWINSHRFFNSKLKIWKMRPTNAHETVICEVMGELSRNATKRDSIFRVSGYP